jgi:predicted O-methyltransferase YrrM
MMQEVLRQILATRSVATASGIERQLHSNVSESEGNFLQELIREHRPQVTLEVGCAYGISSLFICEALREVGGRRHIIVDPFQHSRSGWEGIGLENLRRAGYADFIEFHEAPSYQALAQLSSQGMSIDFALIDGAHTFDYVMVDLFLVDKLLKPTGVVVLDDFQYPSIRKACRYFLTNMPYRSLAPAAPTPVWRKALAEIGAKTPLRKLLAPEALRPGQSLSLPASEMVALQKLRHDLLGEGPEATRRWHDHCPF